MSSPAYPPGVSLYQAHMQPAAALLSTIVPPAPNPSAGVLLYCVAQNFAARLNIFTV